MLPVVIYNGERRWTAATDVGDLLAPVPPELLGYQPRQRYLLIEIRAQDPASLPRDNVLAMIARFEAGSHCGGAGRADRLAGELAQDGRGAGTCRGLPEMDRLGAGAPVR